MRILALHGNRQNGEVFRTRLGPVVRRLEDAGHRVFFVDAPHEVPMGPGDEVPMRTWWTREGGDGAGTSGWDESLAALRGVWTSRGPFQGIVGFSQGAAAGLILCELADAADASFASLRCAVLCAGYALPSRDAIDRPAISGRVRVMLIAGDADEAVPPAETLACASRVHPSTVTIYRHPGNHLFPAKSRDARAVADFFDAEEVGTLEFGTPLPGDGDGDGDGDGIAIPEEVAEELAALAAIFDEEMRTESPADDGPGSTTLSFTLPGVAEAMDPTDPSSYDPRLVLIVPREYPAALPAASLRGVPRAVADRMRTELESTAREAGESCGGGAALFSIVSEVREWAEGAARRAVVAGDFAAVGERRDDDEVDEVDDDDANEDADDDEEIEVGTDRWWESEDTDPALVEAATTEALDAETRLRRARGGADDAPFVVGTGGGRWTFVVGLVGKPSAGKSTFFNAARELAETDRGAARCAPHPFTTIDPNVGRAFAPVRCPCAAAGLRGTCDPAHGSEDVDGEHCRRIPVLVKDVAGLVPGAHAGRGRGNAFLNDLCDADVLVHVVDASGRTDREGVDQGVGDSGAPGESHLGDVAGDVQWVREELHRWIFGNVRRKWRTVRRKPERLQDLFVGYHCVRATVDAALDRMPNVPDPRGGITRERALAWTERELHLLVAHFLRVRFPILLALNKADVVGSDVGIAAVRARWPGEPSVPTSAQTDPGGVRRALKAAVGLKTPTLGFPVDDLDTGASRARRGGGGGGGGTADDTSTERVGSLRECVVLRPGSTAWDLFGAVQSRGGGDAAGDGGGSVVAARGEFVRAECRDGPGGCRRRLMRRDEAIHEGNCVVKFYVNRKASWQGKKK